MNDNVAQAWKRIAQTEDGKIVLQWLMDTYYHLRIEVPMATFQCGQRSVAQVIRNILKN